MPRTQLLFYREAGEVPALDWLERQSGRAQAKMVAAMALLRDHGHELRRPWADLLRDGVYELRVRLGHTNYRLLYSFCERQVVLICAGLTKEGKVPDSEIDRAVARRQRFEADPGEHYADGD